MVRKGGRNMNEKRSIKGMERLQRGASLPLVLLLFLICAMAASVVMAAGTTVVGRASELPESDQAYYSVTSAVNLFHDELMGTNGEGHKVTVAVKANTSSPQTSYQVAVTTDGVAAGSSYSLLERAAIRLLFGEAGVSNAEGAKTAAGKYFATHSWDNWSSQVDFSPGPVEEFDVTHSSVSLDDAQQQALALEGNADINNAGDLVLTLRKTNGNNGGDVAAFNITCATDIESGIIEAAESGADVEIKFATITWTPSTVEKG